MTPGPRYRHLSGQPGLVVRLPTEMVARYRAVDREVVPAPAYVVDTPAHLDRLAESVAATGIRVPLRMGFNRRYGYLDGNHRIAVALRLGLAEVPVELVEEASDAPRGHGQPMRPDDLDVILAAFEQANGSRSPWPSPDGAPGEERGEAGGGEDAGEAGERGDRQDRAGRADRSDGQH